MDVVIPQVGESISEVVLAQWLKAEGTQVATDEVVAELESEKANFELRAEVGGRITHLAKEGDNVQVGAVVARIEEQAAGSNPATEALPKDKETAPTGAISATTETLVVPAVGESITEVVLAQWLKEDGAQVVADEVVAELESEKANFELRTSVAGILKHGAAVGETLVVGATLAHIQPGAPSATLKPTGCNASLRSTTNRG